MIGHVPPRLPSLNTLGPFPRASYMTHYLGALTQFLNNFEPRANFQITLTDPR